MEYVLRDESCNYYVTKVVVILINVSLLSYLRKVVYSDYLF
jgi:hypothetical protein